jgi:DnaJ-class molecular chaperone
MKTCPNCLGEGKVKLTSYLEEVVCWECEGFGEVPNDEDAELPKFTYFLPGSWRK